MALKSIQERKKLNNKTINMRLEDQCALREQCEKIIELGVNYEKPTHFHAYPSMNSGWKVYQSGTFGLTSKSDIK